MSLIQKKRSLQLSKVIAFYKINFGFALCALHMSCIRREFDLQGICVAWMVVITALFYLPLSARVLLYRNTQPFSRRMQRERESSTT